MTYSPEAIARDIAAVSRISSVPVLLRLICQNTGMGFAAVARVTDGIWTPCAVHDEIAFGAPVGSALDLEAILCFEASAARQPVVIGHASTDPVYREHQPRVYAVESYVSVPITLANGEYFGNLCAIDPRPAELSEPRTIAMFTSYAELIANQLDLEDREEAMVEALSSERALSALREQFIAVLGHDLRNPLGAVMALAEVLAQRGQAADAAAIGRRIKASGKRMSALIDDVMDLARTRLGSGMGVEIVWDDELGAALGAVVAELHQSHPGHDVTQDIVIDRPVHCDRGRLQQLLSNLLANAFQHGTPSQPVHVRAMTEGDRLIIEVVNRGAPIDADSLGKVFEPYWRPASGKQGGGLGLGLHICMQIAKAHGGRMSVTSSAHAGTRFAADLPTGIKPTE